VGKITRLFRTISGIAKCRAAKAVSFEITKTCNLHCQHCYRRDFEGDDLSDDEWIKKFQEFKDKGYIQAAWVGGEPLLRRNLLEIGRNYFPINAIITNGTIPMPKWNDCLFGVSVDGTKEIYEKIRGNVLIDQYEKVRSNILDAVKNGNKVFVLMTIHKINQGAIEEFVKDWKGQGARGVILDFYTPQVNEPNNSIWLGFRGRDKVIDRISALRKKYGEFLPWNTPLVIDKMRSSKCPKATGNCRKWSLAQDPVSLRLNFKGKRMYPCIMGAQDLKDATIDCGRCGCIFAFLFDVQSYWTSLKTIFLK
jgi:MoaA/NifB/PqqE/SkfB family radical SAM enzyme